MKKNSLYIFVLSLMIATSLQATPGDGILDFEFPCVDGNINQEVCLPLFVDDFTNVSFAQIPVQWDPAKLVFVKVQNEVFPFGIAVENQMEGTLRYIIQDGTLENPLNADDGTAILEVCFTVLTDGPTVAFVENTDIVDVPPTFPLQVLNGDGDTKESASKSGAVSINMAKVAFCINEPELIVGERACFALKAANFTSLQSFQFSLDFDPAVMTFKEAVNLNTEMAFDIDAFNLFEPGNLRLSWFSFNPGGVTLENGDVIAEFCFDVTALSTEDEILAIGNRIPGGIEATDTQNNLIAVENNCTGLSYTDSFVKNVLDFSLSPNPASNDLQIARVDNSRYTYEILDLQGKLIRTAKEGRANTSIDINNLDAGVYFIKIQQGTKIGTRKFVKL